MDVANYLEGVATGFVLFVLLVAGVGAYYWQRPGKAIRMFMRSAKNR